MFEKSKSAITFKELQDKMNIVNNLENDWGHFYDPDDNNVLFLDNSYFYREPQKPTQIPIQKPTQIPIQEPIQKPFIDIEKQKPEPEQNPEQKPEIFNLKNYIYKNNKITIFIETIFTYIKTPLITLSMAYFIFKII